LSTYLVRVFYIGTKYYGSQWQPDAKTIQGELIDAIEEWDGQKHSIEDVQLSGRTDKGVHSIGQIGLIVTDKKMDLDQINRHLPDDISIWAYVEAPDGFKPRFNVLARHYRYYYRITGDIFDIENIRVGVQKLIGSHNFALISKPDGDRNTIATILNASVQAYNDVLIFDFIGTRFLWKLVRKSVSLLLQIGHGKHSPEIVSDLLSLEPTAGGIEPAPPEGLVLVESIVPIFMQQNKNAIHRIKRYLEENIAYFTRMNDTLNGVNDDFLSERRIPF
jgi:tRNA pseudouridine38-40 synthase